eukprot:15153507-Ditylum_brightwellii.AAC.1
MRLEGSGSGGRHGSLIDSNMYVWYQQLCDWVGRSTIVLGGEGAHSILITDSNGPGPFLKCSLIWEMTCTYLPLVERGG